jgi:predicted amidohydrolase
MSLCIHAWTQDVGTPVADAAAYVEDCVQRVERSWAEGADLVLLPEYSWAGLEPLLPERSLHAVSDYFWHQVWPTLQPRLSRPGHAAVLGTVPWLEPSTGRLFNRCPILCDGRIFYQDKLSLTPWEDAFQPGQSVQIFELKGQRCAVLICLDVEMAEHSLALRGQELDVLLVPSATETLMGVERVNRCASARAVELGCAVVVSHLVGTSSSSLVDENVGLLACYLPSQSFSAELQRQQVSSVFTEGFHLAKFPLPTLPQRVLLRSKLETNPALLEPRRVPPVVK